MTYLAFKALHIIAMVAFFAGAFYLPRLFVYHTRAETSSELDLTLREMERKLLKVIINPSIIALWLFGILMIVWNPDLLSQGWLHAKLLLVVLLSGFHGMMVKWQRAFAQGLNTRSERFYRLVNEIPTVLLILIVLLAVFRPF